MREVGDDVATCALGGFEPFSHVVERAGELAELTRGVVMADSGRRVTLADQTRCVRDGL